MSNAIQHNIPETARQADGALSTVVGFFNNVVLYPVKKANLTFRYKLEAFEDDLKEKIKNIPEENLQVPPVKIAGPVLEALRYEILLQLVSIVPCLCVFGISHFGLYYLYSSTRGE